MSQLNHGRGSTPDRVENPSRWKLYRDTEHAAILGVCAGVADYAGIERTFVRAVTVLLGVPFFFAVVIVYILLALVLERRPSQLYADPEEERFWRSARLEPSRTTSELVGKFTAIERRLEAAEARVVSSEFKLRRAFRDLEDDA